jgi:hypothetical protein
MIVADEKQMLQNRQKVGIGWRALDHVPKKEEAAVEVVEIKLHVVKAVLQLGPIFVGLQLPNVDLTKEDVV